MAKYQAAGDSIECEKSSIEVRYISNSPFATKLEGYEGRLYKYKTNTRTLITIEKQLSPNKDGKIVGKINENSKVDIGDLLDAYGVEIYLAKQLKNLAYKSNASNVHGAQVTQVNAFTYAIITAPWKFLTEGKLLISKN